MKRVRLLLAACVAVAAGLVPAIALAGAPVRPQAQASTTCVLGVCVPIGGSSTTTTSTSTTTTGATTATTVTAPEASASAATGVVGPSGTTTTAGATLNGTVNLDGDSASSCDFDYGTTTSTTSLTNTVACTPTPTNSTSTNQTVSAALTGLVPNTTYYYDVVLNWYTLAIPPTGTATSSVLSFTTPATGSIPTAATAAASAIGGSGATLNATVNPNNWSITSCTFTYTPAGGTAKTASCGTTPAGGSAVTVSAPVTGLSEGTAYTYTLSVGYGSGATATTATSTSSGSFTTMSAAVSTPAQLLATTATLNGTVNPEGQTVTDCEFYYGTTVSSLTKAPCSPTASSISGTSPVTVTAAVTGLAAKTTYFESVILTTAGGIAVAPIQTFTTPSVAVEPKATESATTQVTATSAVLHGVVDAEGQGVRGCAFIWGYTDLTTTQGVNEALTSKCSTTPAANGSQKVTATLKGLAPGTRYYARLVFVTYGGLAESNQVTFNTTTRAARPAVKITSVTVNAKAGTAKFAFKRSGSLTATRGFQCALATVTHGKVGALKYAACRSGKTYRSLKATTYVFAVRAGNGVGFGTAKTHRFTI